jgi:hypothetical protein
LYHFVADQRLRFSAWYPNKRVINKGAEPEISDGIFGGGGGG